MLFICLPTCSTCKRALNWLREHGFEPEIRDIRAEAPTAAELIDWWQRSGVERRRLFNTSGQLYRELGLARRQAGLSDDEVVDLLDGEGMLVRRPILVTEAGVLFGFREKEWEALLL
ncbi:MAG: Spx/MgsR family RNA polymerase-binding regulatory protein [Bacillota bacterium]|nr:Spx/MgsR family RNA polymerase-binding regulatory protein [Bacillota bacterium]